MTSSNPNNSSSSVFLAPLFHAHVYTHFISVTHRTVPHTLLHTVPFSSNEDLFPASLGEYSQNFSHTFPVFAANAISHVSFAYNMSSKLDQPSSSNTTLRIHSSSFLATAVASVPDTEHSPRHELPLRPLLYCL